MPGRSPSDFPDLGLKRREPKEGFATLYRFSRWAFNPKGEGPDVIRMIFIVNPLLIFVFTVLSTAGSGHFWNGYLCGLVIGTCVVLTCFCFTELLGLIGVRLLKIAVRRRTFALASLAGMGPGLWLGFQAAGWAAPYLGLHWDPPTIRDYGSGLTMGSMIFVVIILLDLWLIAQTNARQLENESLQAKLSALSAQLNPHLLFNALNTIASTISSDPHAAEETTMRLSELYRGILASSKATTHPLSTELEICRAYLGVESARFGDRLRWSVDAEPGLESVEIPTLLIQPIVENAIKHGLSHRASGGTVRVQVARSGGYIDASVEDDGVGLGNSQARKSAQTGVSSCRARLELVYRGKASFEMGARAEGAGTRVCIRIPADFEVKIK